MARKTAKKEGRAATRKKTKRKELAPMDATAEALIPRTKQKSLAAWFELYMARRRAGPP